MHPNALLVKLDMDWMVQSYVFNVQLGARNAIQMYYYVILAIV